MRRRQLKLEDFRASIDGRYPALLRPDARKTFMNAFERRLMTEVTPAGDDEAIPYRLYLHRQARQIRDLIEGRVAFYQPFRLRA